MHAGPASEFDALVIGGGFYGCVIALYLTGRRGLSRVLLVERESALMKRASYNNQARVHNGYHYPRSFVTANRSRQNFPLFLRDWPAAVKQDFTKIYALARCNSRTTARQFQRFCREIGASLEPADPGVRQLFDQRRIEDVFVAQEYAFDATQLTHWANEELSKCGVTVFCDARVTSVSRRGRRLESVTSDPGGNPGRVSTRLVFNCTYSGLNQFGGDWQATSAGLKHEVAEMALLEAPAALARFGITVMDGPFFSLMPFPARQLHTLSHVRYTPHLNWQDAPGTDPYARLQQYPRHSRVDRMVRDACRYVPALAAARYVDSLFEIKTVLVKNEGDDGRPILFERQLELPGCYSILGGKIDNVYDVLEKLNGESFDE